MLWLGQAHVGTSLMARPRVDLSRDQWAVWAGLCALAFQFYLPIIHLNEVEETRIGSAVVANEPCVFAQRGTNKAPHDPATCSFCQAYCHLQSSGCVLAVSPERLPAFPEPILRLSEWPGFRQPNACLHTAQARAPPLHS